MKMNGVYVVKLTSGQIPQHEIRKIKKLHHFAYMLANAFISQIFRQVLEDFPFNFAVYFLYVWWGRC